MSNVDTPKLSLHLKPRFEELLNTRSTRSTRYTRRVDRAPRCTTLIDAAYWGKYDECRSLVQSGVDPDIKTEYGGWTAVMLAAESGHKNIVQLLCEAGARVNIRDDHGASALDIAAEEKKYPTCRYLIHAGADFSRSENAILELAADQGDLAMTKYLTEGECSTN